jgi:outer membrane receptor protein involved in Fe transport
LSEPAATSAPRRRQLRFQTLTQRRGQSAAVAATVLTADDLRKHEVKGVDDLEFSTPSLAIAHNGQSNQINIRGIGKEDNSGNATSAVAIYRDGIGTISGFATDEPYYDISTVEVLRGPQGTFSGENAAGGAIFINTRDPDPSGGYSGYVEGGYGNYNEFDAQGAVNLPLLDTLAVRVAFNHVNRDSFFTVWFDPAMTTKNPQDVGARDYNSVRLGILWEPLDDLQVKLKVDYNNLDNHGYAFGIVNGWPFPGGGFFGGPFTRRFFLGPVMAVRVAGKIHRHPRRLVVFVLRRGPCAGSGRPAGADRRPGNGRQIGPIGRG